MLLRDGQLRRDDAVPQTGKHCNPAAPLPDGVFRVLLIAVILLAAAIRIWRFGAVPGGFNQDGAMAAVDAKALADYGTDRFGMRLPVHFTAWGYGQMSVLMSYLMVPFIKLFGLSAVTARLPSLLVSLAGLAFLYLFSRSVFGRGPALAVLFFAAVDPWHIMQSRWALDCNLYPHFFMAGIYFLERCISGRRTNLYVSMVLFGLCMYCYGVALYTLPVFLLAACVYLLVSKRLPLRCALISLGVWLLVAWPFLAVMAINYFGLETVETPLFTLPFFPDSVRSGDILLFSSDISHQLAVNAKALGSLLLQLGSDLPWNQIKGFGTLYLFSLPFTLLGAVLLAKKHLRSPGGVFVLLFFLTGVFGGLMTNSVNVNRANILYYPLILLTGLGIWYAVSALRLPGLAAPAMCLAAFALFTVTYFTTWADSISYYFMADFGAAVSAVKDSDADRIYITADSQRDGASQVSEILTLFYHQTDARYYQGETPDRETPFREKYVFESTSALRIDPEENAVYVAAQKDLSLFDPDDFDIVSYGLYFTAVPKDPR